MAQIRLSNIVKKFTNKTDPSRYFSFLFFGTAVLDTYRSTKELVKGAAKRNFSINNLSLTVHDGKVMVILGPSGCGKSTLLRLLAGFTKPDSGDILFDNKSVLDVQPKYRNIGMVFQDFALYPHFSAKKNIVSYFFFKGNDPEIEAEAKERLQKTSELMGVDIEYLMDRKPFNLSGGEKQRVALGRCITRNPGLFLLDEPFSNLDQKLKEKYRVQLKTLLNHFNITTVYVTHDQQEAMILADLVAVMRDGNIEQTGTIEELYNNPKNCFVAEFINIQTDIPSICYFKAELLDKSWTGMKAGVRPEDFQTESDGSVCSISAIVLSARQIPLKRKTIVTARVEDTEFYFETDINTDFNKDDQIYIYCKKVFLFDKATEELIKIIN